MEKIIGRSVCTLCLLGICGILNAQITLSGMPDTSLISAGDTFQVVIRLEGNAGFSMNGLEVNLAFDTSIFEVVSLSDLVGWQVQLANDPGNEDGILNFAGGQLTADPVPPGDLDMLEISIHARSAGSCIEFDFVSSTAVTSPQVTTSILEAAYSFYASAGPVISTSVCSNESIQVGSSSFSSPGTYDVVLTSQNGCDSLVVLMIEEILDTTHQEIFYSGCAGDGYSVIVALDTFDVGNPSGTVVLPGQNQFGCDSIVDVELSFAPVTTDTVATIHCQGDGYSLVVGADVYDETSPAGETVLENANQFGCDSLVVVNLAFLPVSMDTLASTHCQGDGYSIVVGADVYDEGHPSGTTVLPGASQSGCDSIVTVMLDYFPASDNVVSSTHCQGDGYSLEVGGDVYDESNPSGTTILTGENQYGCDSLVIVSLEFNPLSFTMIQTAHCADDGYQLIVGPDVYDSSNPAGTTVLTGLNRYGCDSIVEVDLAFFPSTVTLLEDVLCAGDPYAIQIGNDLYNESNPSGTTVLPGANQFGCDSIVEVFLDFLPVSGSVIEGTYCTNDGYSIVVGGDVYDMMNPAGTTVLQGANQYGCDSIVEVMLDYLPVSLSMIEEDHCAGGGYVLQVGNDLYNASNPAGITVLPGANSVGCDSIIEVDLTFHPPGYSVIEGSHCTGDGYSLQVGGDVYNEMNPAGQTILPGAGQYGCDSIVDVDLTFEETVMIDYSENRCSGDGYTLLVGDDLYNEQNPTGSTVLPAMDGDQCDTLVFIDLQFFPAITYEYTETHCTQDSFFLVIGEDLYDVDNPSGTTTLPGASQFGCDSVVNVELIFREPDTVSIEKTVCSGDGYFIQVGETIFDESNPAGTEILANAQGCDSLIIVDLSFIPPDTVHIDTATCANEMFFLQVGEVFFDAQNPSGEVILTGADGCDSIVQVEIRVFETSRDTIEETHPLDSGFVLAVGEDIYDQENPSGETVLEGMNRFGCDSIVFVNLIYEATTPVNQFAIDDIEIYPNPVNDQLTIKNCPHFMHIRLIDPQGRVFQQFNPQRSGNQMTVDMADLEDGIYWLQLISDASGWIKPIIKNEKK